jgi:hypothetical protein
MATIMMARYVRGRCQQLINIAHGVQFVFILKLLPREREPLLLQ